VNTGFGDVTGFHSPRHADAGAEGVAGRFGNEHQPPLDRLVALGASMVMLYTMYRMSELDRQIETLRRFKEVAGGISQGSGLSGSR
jgi:hypothetical protein